MLTLLLHVRPGEVEEESNDPVAGDEEDRGDGQHKIRDYTQDKQQNSSLQIAKFSAKTKLNGIQLMDLALCQLCF